MYCSRVMHESDLGILIVANNFSTIIIRPIIFIKKVNSVLVDPVRQHRCRTTVKKVRSYDSEFIKLIRKLKDFKACLFAPLYWGRNTTTGMLLLLLLIRLPEEIAVLTAAEYKTTNWYYSSDINLLKADALRCVKWSCSESNPSRPI
jgi:hypothetical protein